MRSQLEATLPRDYYLSPEIFALERERIFFSEWFCGGRDEQLPKPGDYLALDVCGESALVVRAADGTLRAHYNLCRHRGSRLVQTDLPEPRAGSAFGPLGNFGKTIRCPYHAWTYNLDGGLRTAPFLDEADRFYKEEFSLYEIGISSWGGFFFLNFSPRESRERAHTLAAVLGPIPERVSRYPLADLRIAHRIVYDVGANWKVILENYNECYHCGGVHPELCEIVPAFKKAGGGELDWDRGIPHRAGAFTFSFSGVTNRAPFPGLDDDEKIRHKGELIYPNFMVSLAADHAAAFTLWPRSPESTVVVCDFLFHPGEMAKPEFDPMDAVQFWDLVNRQDWTICESVQRGMRSRMFRYGFYAPMENLSLDIRRYVRERLGDAV